MIVIARYMCACPCYRYHHYRHAPVCFHVHASENVIQMRQLLEFEIEPPRLGADCNPNGDMEPPDGTNGEEQRRAVLMKLRESLLRLESQYQALLNVHEAREYQQAKENLRVEKEERYKHLSHRPLLLKEETLLESELRPTAEARSQIQEELSCVRAENTALKEEIKYKLITLLHVVP
eukprot:GHVU01067198.1.p1 GENE.GHVU01067198.1~~GHVU01067198.1.p1  ORF type:complete len:178 (+),score=23.95 GHVU01067198.1:955-1488(+)